MKTFSSAILLFLFALSSLGQASQDPNLYSNGLFGVTLTKPEDWFFVTTEQSPIITGKERPTEEEFQSLLTQFAGKSLVFLSKYQEPFDDLNPNMSIVLHPSEDVSMERAKAALGFAAKDRETNSENFKMIVPAKEAKLQGHVAAYTRFQYSFKAPDGRLVPDAAELWVLPRGNHFLLINVSLRPDETTGKRKEFDPILKSLRLEPVSAIVPKGTASRSPSEKLFMNAKKKVPARMEWNREIVTKTGGEVRFVVQSAKPFGVTLVTDNAHNDLMKGVKRKYGKDDVLLTFDCNNPSCEKTVPLKPGSYHFIIENQSDEMVEIKLQCYGAKK